METKEKMVRHDYIFTLPAAEGLCMCERFVYITAANWEEARAKMFEKYGTRWAFQYEAQEFFDDCSRQGLSTMMVESIEA